MLRNVFLAMAVVVAAVSAASAGPVVITEWMYQVGTGSNPGTAEYFEITNTGNSPVSMTGWTQDDVTSHSSGGPGPHSLAGFGTLQPGESAVGIDGSDVAAFRTYWGLSASVKVIAYGTSNGLGRVDEINIYDNTNALVDRLTYDDQTLGHVRTQGISANVPFSQLGLNHANLAVTSSVGDIYGSYRGGLGTVNSDLGNPGTYPVPEPSTCVLLAFGATLLAVRRQRQA